VVGKAAKSGRRPTDHAHHHVGEGWPAGADVKNERKNTFFPRIGKNRNTREDRESNRNEVNDPISSLKGSVTCERASKGKSPSVLPGIRKKVRCKETHNNKKDRQSLLPSHLD